MPRWGAERRARPLHFLRSRRPRSSARGMENGRAPHRYSMRLLHAPIGAPPPFFLRGGVFLAMLFGLAFLGLSKSWRRQSSGAKGHRDNEWTHVAKGHQGIFKGHQVMARRRPTRSFPGRLTLEAWLARSLRARTELVWRAQCDLLGSFRFCTKTPCRRERTCRGDDPGTCRHRLWCLKRVKPKTLRDEWSRLERLRSL